jgi:site-specific DNA-methyltransferase (cytosine-N4-specific)
MKQLLQDSEKFYTPKRRPSGHDISSRFGQDNGGAIPSNLLDIPNTESNSQYLRSCAKLGVEGHPARFPQRLPEFFIRFLTNPGDLVLDIFAGSNTTGSAAERLGRKWLAFDLDRTYLAASSFRFLSEPPDSLLEDIFNHLMTHDHPLDLSPHIPKRLMDDDRPSAVEAPRLP